MKPNKEGLENIDTAQSLTALDTELPNAASACIDRLNTLEMVTLINQEDKKVALAVEAVLPDIAKAVDGVYDRLKNGGRMIYCGAGTSGRMGILDASECPPTFGVPDGMIRAIMAGGAAAGIKAAEGAEDDEGAGEEALKDIAFSPSDVLVGLAASGRTPFVLGAMRYARETGGLVIGLACVKNPVIRLFSDILINPLPGAEVITGSTRLKAGTAQKMVLNMLSTGVMIKLGKVYGHYMVDVKATNEKLRFRACSIVSDITGVSREEAAGMLTECGFAVKPALVALQLNITPEEANERLAQYNGQVSAALAHQDR